MAELPKQPKKPTARAMDKYADKIDDLKIAKKRWEAKFKRAENKLKKIDKQLKYYEKQFKRGGGKQ